MNHAKAAKPAEEGQDAAEAVRLAERQGTAAPARRGERDHARAYWDGVAAAATSPVRAGTAQGEMAQPATARTGAEQGTAATRWLIALYVDPSGQARDSLGRGASPGEVAAVVAADKAVQRERDARWNYLQGAYRDPHATRAALDELLKRQGWTSAVARVAREPEQFGQLRGKMGFFAGVKARAERDPSKAPRARRPGPFHMGRPKASETLA